VVENLDEVQEDISELLRVVLDRPWFLFVEVLICQVDECTHSSITSPEIENFHRLLVQSVGGDDNSVDSCIYAKAISASSVGIVLAKKRTGAIRDISETIHKSTVIEIMKSGRRIIDILPHSPTSDSDKVPECIGSVHFYDILGNHDIPKRFAHLLPTRCHESMHENILGGFHIGRQEHRHVDDSMEPGNILPDDVEIGRVISFEFLLIERISDTGKVVGKRIAPNIHHLGFIARDRNPPRHLVGASGETDVVEPFAKE